MEIKKIMQRIGFCFFNKELKGTPSSRGHNTQETTLFLSVVFLFYGKDQN